MSTVYKVLGQVQGTAAEGTYADLYTVPSSTTAVISTIAVCNQSASAMTYRIAVASSSSPTTAEFIAYGSYVAPNTTVFLTVGLTLQAGKKLVISSSANTGSFGAFGSEIA